MNIPDELKPGFRVELKTDASVRLYNKMLVVKIIVQLIVLGLLITLCADWQTALMGIGIGVVWILISEYKKRRNK